MKLVEISDTRGMTVTSPDLNERLKQRERALNGAFANGGFSTFFATFDLFRNLRSRGNLSAYVCATNGLSLIKRAQSRRKGFEVAYQ